MCLASVFTKSDGKEKLVADKVIRILIDKHTGEILCVNLFGERVMLPGKLECIDFQNSCVKISRE